VRAALGHARDLGALIARWNAAGRVEEFDAVAADVAGHSGLIEFLSLDLGEVLEIRAPQRAYRMVRIIAGNPVTMSEMAVTVPDVGSYAPISIVVSDRPDGVHLSYDTVSSALAPYDSPDAAAVAAALDDKVLELLRHAATG